jgi:antitoxin (DNA-binding transcriptional repressor) of toxin-antitoxin stability system
MPSGDGRSAEHWHGSDHHKRGRPVARLLPIDAEAAVRPIFGWMKGTGEIVGDIMEPLDVRWEANED